MSQEIAFEYLLAAHEVTRGTAVNPPTRYLPLAGLVTPGQDRYRPVESRGELAEFHRSKTVRRWSDLDAEGPVDTRAMPFLLAMILKGTVTPTTPGGATTARLWTFTRTMTSDDLKSATVYSGDPNVQAFQAAYMLPTDFSMSSDASGTDGVQMSMTLQGNFPAKTAPSSVPAQSLGPILAPGDMQIWMDTTLAIGTTEIADFRFVSTELSVPTGVTPKWTASGPTGGLNPTRRGRAKSHPEASISLEIPDMVHYDLYAGNNGDTIVKLRVRFNGPIIETTLRHFVEFDIYGPLDDFSWGELEGTNRLMEAMIMGEKDATAGSDLIIRVQNDQTTY